MTAKQTINVLLLDNDFEISKNHNYSFRNNKFCFVSATTPDEAFGVLTNSTIDVVVADIRFPGMDCLEFLRLVISRYPNIQIIISSSCDDIESAVEALKLGAIDVLRKPADFNALLFSLNSSDEKWRLRRKLSQANQDLEKEKEFLAVTMRSIGDGVIATDLEGRVTMINKVAEELTGWPSEEAFGKPLNEVFYIINEKTRKVCENPVAKVLETGRIIGLANHTALITRYGSEISIADSAAPIRDANNTTIGTVLVFRDVTIEKRVNEELIKAKKLESVGILAGGIAHDFNNILTGIMGNINLAKILTMSNQDIHELLEAAESASKRASKLTKQLLTFSKGGEPIRAVTSVYDLVRESADFALSGSNINCRIDRDSDLWFSEIDRDQIGQAVQNIVLNARQAMPEGGTIHILCENYQKISVNKDDIPLDEGDYIRIIISDEGIGIHLDQIEKIFDPYFSTKQEGSGLGLAVTHCIVKKHFGHIMCDSNPGKGAIFTIYLPATTKLVDDDLLSHEVLKDQGRIMIMDDEEMVRTIAKKILMSRGFEVISVRNGDEALGYYTTAMAEANPIDIVIMDLTIPGGMGGRETIKKLLDIDPNAAAIVSSGYSNDPVMANYRKYGFKGILEKPYTMEKLMKVVSKVRETIKG